MAIDIKSTQQLDSAISSASFTPIGEPIWDAKIPRTVIGIWDSPVMDGGEYLLGWRDVTYIASKHDGEYIVMYARTGATEDLSDVSWGDPSLNLETSISAHTDRYLQIRLMLVAKVYIPIYYTYSALPSGGPTINEMIITGVTSETASLFFTEAFELGFSPVSVVLTTESDVPVNSVLRFGVTNMDSVDLDDYQWISENDDVDLNMLAATGTKFKIVMEMSGSTGDTITVHELAAMFGGEEYGQIRLNE